MKCSIGIVGSELLLPGFVDSHFNYIKEKLWPYGISVFLASYLKDDIYSIKEFLKLSSKFSELIIITGGLGPTEDDVTKNAVSEFLNLNLVYDERIETKIIGKFKKLGRTPPENSFRQAFVIKGAEIIENDVGIAPGLFLKENGKEYLLLPGPPEELKNVFRKFLNKLDKNVNIERNYRFFKIAGASEPYVDEKIEKISRKLKDFEYTILSKDGDIEIIASSTDIETLTFFENKLREVFKREFYSSKGEKLEDVVSKLLKEKGLTIGVSESCTGGYLSKKLTDIPGSSRYFLGGVVVYSNEIKVSILGINRGVLEKYGAVSSQVAIMMAARVREKFRSDLGVGITGIAGPGGGSKEKPVGTVYIAVTFGDSVKVKKFVFPGNREKVRLRATQMALDMIRKTIIKG